MKNAVDKVLKEEEVRLEAGLKSAVEKKMGVQLDDLNAGLSGLQAIDGDLAGPSKAFGGVASSPTYS